MKKYNERRTFLKNLSTVPALTLAGNFVWTSPFVAGSKVEKTGGSKLKISLNAYSFNDPLTKKTMTLDDLLDFCAEYNFDAVDLTGYYFPGYPTVPEDAYIYHLKQKAHRLGLDISGTGIRNDFTNPDKRKRKDDIHLIKKWIECAAKLGAPVLRIFTGPTLPEGHSWDEVVNWMIVDMKECAAYGAQNGIFVAIQNHNDSIKTGDQAQKIVEMVNSDWFGLVLDIGSYRTGDPYKQIEQTAKFAVNWQLKEMMYVEGREQKTDLRKVLKIVASSVYRGYLPIETLGAGDPKIKVPEFLTEVRNALAAIET